MKSEAIGEAEQFLADNPDIRFISVMLTELNGIQRGKLIRRHELLPIYRNGRPLPSSILSLNVLGEDVPATGLVWDVGDCDCLTVPVPGTLKRCPWLPETAQLLLTMQPEQPMQKIVASDPRQILRRVIAALTAAGYHPVVACELEFYLLDKTAWLAGEVRSATTPAGYRLEQTQVYSIADVEHLHVYLRDLYAACDAQGIPAETAISEYAPGQVEITLTHRADALQAVDEAIQYKRIVKAIADRHGMVACFMAKPFTDCAGSGMHLHISLADAEGNNLYADAAPDGNALLRHSIGGMAATVADTMLVYAPHANSYRRFRSNSYAPTAVTWGVNNRTVSLRIPPGGANTRHVEHRICGADANPYLAMAAVLSGIHAGIRDRLDPGPPVSGDGYQATTAGARIPTDWNAAIGHFESSAFVAEYLGETFRTVFAAIKREEIARFYGEVTARDHQWYLDNV